MEIHEYLGYFERNKTDDKKVSSVRASIREQENSNCDQQNQKCEIYKQIKI